MTEKQIEAAARAIHAYELEHGYITRAWGGEDEMVYLDMARAALIAALPSALSGEEK